MLRKLTGDKTLFKRFFLIAIPIIIQNGITNFVSLLDNIMVGQVGSIQMSGVSIVNGLIFVFNLCIFGASSGAGIFTAQFFGSDDDEGIRYTFRFKLMICTLLSAVCMGLLLLAGTPLIGLYLQGEGDAAEAAQVLQYGLEYLHVMLWGFVPFALCNAYASTLRETAQTTVPMVAGIIAVLVNLVLNYVLIFGHFGAPAMGVVGAALATVISRYVELLIVAVWVHTHSNRCKFIRGAYRSMYIPGALLKNIIVKGMPLLANEALWSGGMAFLNQCYSTCGLEVVPAMNISSTIFNLASVVFIAGGNAVGIMMGQMLGASYSAEEIHRSNRKLLLANVIVGGSFGILLGAIARVFPMIYNTSDEVRSIAAKMMIASAVAMPFCAFAHSSYFTLRSGGQVMITLLFDSVYMWALVIPFSLFLAHLTPLTIIPFYALSQCTDIVKAWFGYALLKKGTWVRQLVADPNLKSD